jgi:hypothetical protein
VVSENSILADSSAATDCRNITFGTGTTSFTGVANLIESHIGCVIPEVTADPELEPLELQTPGLTPVHPIAPTSPARDAGDEGATCSTLDQRLVARSGVCDIGAYELESADLVVTHTESVDPVVAGSGTGNLVYTVSVVNASGFVQSGVEITELVTLPAGVSVESVVPSDGTFAGGVWSVQLLFSVPKTLTITLTVAANAAAGADVIGGSASITDADLELTNTGNDSDADTTSIVRNVDLQLTIEDTPDPVVVGAGPGSLVYVVTLLNDGPSNASGVTVGLTPTLPAGVNVGSVVPSAGNFNTGVWSLATLAAGVSRTLTITLDVGGGATPAVDAITFAASVTGANETLVLTADDTDSESTTIVPPAIFKDGFESGDTSAWSATEPP